MRYNNNNCKYWVNYFDKNFLSRKKLPNAYFQFEISVYCTVVTFTFRFM